MGTAGTKEYEAVLAAFGLHPSRCEVKLLPSSFSGAMVYQVRSSDAVYALKRWPKGQPAHTPLTTIHAWISEARSQGITILPEVMLSRSQSSVYNHAGHDWELLSWRSGQPVDDPSDEHLRQALQALYLLHQTWTKLHPPVKAVCPAVSLQYERLDVWKSDEWSMLTNSVAHQAADLLRKKIPVCLQVLEPWLHRKVSISPCIADIWADHLLFEDNTLTGLIDLGGARLDHPAQDVARLLTSYSLTATRSLEPWLLKYPDHSDTYVSLASVLYQTSLVTSLSNWLRWLYLEHLSFPNMERCHQRMQQIYFRLCNPQRELLI